MATFGQKVIECEEEEVEVFTAEDLIRMRVETADAYEDHNIRKQRQSLGSVLLMSLIGSAIGSMLGTLATGFVIYRLMFQRLWE